MRLAQIKLYIGLAVCTVWVAACVKPFQPAITTVQNNYLVVEGLINISDSTIIKLSRTTTIQAAVTFKPELKAVVTIESNTGTSYAVKEIGNGVYTAASYNLSASNQYRVRIKTASGSTYASDFTQAKTSPPIDSVTWKTTTNAVNIYVNSHDAGNGTRYYRWGFSETWLFHTDYLSTIISDGLNVRFRTSPEQIYQCYGTDVSTSIALGSSAQLSNDVIRSALINTISSDAEKISTRYSIEVKQYALTKDAYDYWTLLKKNTENLGSIFDAQPSASIGNLHNVNNAAEVVIGYISAGSVTKSRIFIDKKQLPNWVTSPAYPIVPDCGLDTLNILNPYHPTTNGYVNWKSPLYIRPGAPLVPIEALGDPPPVAGLTNGAIITATEPKCADCTLRGSTTKPAYWQ